MKKEKTYLKKSGKYIAQVKRPPNGWFGEAGEKKTPFIRIPLIIKEAEVSENDDQIDAEIVWRGFITENAVSRTIKTLTKAFGWNGDLESLCADQWITSYDNPDMVLLKEGQTTESDPFTKKLCRITCEEEEYDGKSRIVIKWLNPEESQPAPAIDHKALKSIISSVADIAKNAAKEAIDEMNAKADKSKHEKATKKAVTGAAMAPRYTKTHDDEGDEIPF